MRVTRNEIEVTITAAASAGTSSRLIPVTDSVRIGAIRIPAAAGKHGAYRPVRSRRSDRASAPRADAERRFSAMAVVSISELCPAIADLQRTVITIAMPSNQKSLRTGPDCPRNATEWW